MGGEMKNKITFDATFSISAPQDGQDTLCLILDDVYEGLARQVGKKFGPGDKVKISIEEG
jgi:hypothetical protein